MHHAQLRFQIKCRRCIDDCGLSNHCHHWRRIHLSYKIYQCPSKSDIRSANVASKVSHVIAKLVSRLCKCNPDSANDHITMVFSASDREPSKRNHTSSVLCCCLPHQMPNTINGHPPITLKVSTMTCGMSTA